MLEIYSTPAALGIPAVYISGTELTFEIYMQPSEPIPATYIQLFDIKFLPAALGIKPISEIYTLPSNIRAKFAVYKQ